MTCPGGIIMAKKLVFLLVMIFVLLSVSVTVFAGTGSDAPEVGFTDDKANLENKDSGNKVRVSDLEEKYGEVFFGEDSESSTEIVSINYGRVYPFEMRHEFFGQTNDYDIQNPHIMLMYIKRDGKYVRLKDVERKTNITEEICYLNTVVDLENIGQNKVNEVRVIIFRKNDVDNLVLDENLQITNFEITFRRWNPVERAFFELKQVFN
jgi:hypothetical protein